MSCITGDYGDSAVRCNKNTKSESYSQSAEHVEGAYSRPLAYINDWIQDIPRDRHFYLHCIGGYRSMIASSILLSRGYRNFTDIEGGFASIAQTGVPKTDYVCQSKISKK